MIVSFVFSAAKHRTFWFVALGGLTLIVAGAVRWYSSVPRLNIILVTLDTTRADRLGAYGYQHGLTQGFDDFARRGVIFDRAYAPAPVTLPSHATMLTGLYPPEHGLRVNGSGRLDRRIPLLSEILQEHGYETGAFIAAVVLDSQYGLDRGFDTYDDDLPTNIQSPNPSGERRRDGKEVVDRAVSWIQQRTSCPFFCWIHLFDAHAPYDSRPAVYHQQFVDHPYDAGVAWETQQFARLTTFLKDRRLDANTLVVVVGDHGEGLDEHMEIEHGMLVYNTTLLVPLVFVGPRDCQPGTRVPNAVSLVDLTPTLLDILRIPAPNHVSGRSLLAALKGQALDARDCYAEAESPYLLNRWSPLHAVISQRWKYIQTTRPELYDLEHDPGELTNLAESDGDECQRMRTRLTAMQHTFIPTTAQIVELSEKERANLQTLGYVSGGTATGAGDEQKVAEDLTDVKDMLPFLAKFETAKHMGLEGKLDESIIMLQEVAQATQEFPAANLLLGDCLAQAGRLDEAGTTYRSVLSQRPDFVRARFSLGRILANQGRLDQAEAEFREFLKENPYSATAHFELAQVLAQLQKLDEAVLEYREALRIAPDLTVANISLGQVLAMQGRPNDAAAAFEGALKDDPRSEAAHANLMMLFAKTGQYDNALRHGRQAVALEPNSFESRFNLGIVLVANGQYADGISQLREAQRLRPDDPRPAQQIQQAEAALK